jgi:1,2-diacylglycerol 3-beta-galactosyltransferase
MHPELPAVLLMGGGEGMGPVEETARALGEELYDHRRQEPVGQIVVICGRNQALFSTLQCLTWKVPVKVPFCICRIWGGGCLVRCAYQMDVSHPTAEF